MDGAKVSFLHVSQNVPTDSPMEVGDKLISSKKGERIKPSCISHKKYNVLAAKCPLGMMIEQ